MVAKKRGALELADDARRELRAVARSRTEPVRRVERARMLLWYADGEKIAEIMRRLGTNRPKVERCVDKALSIGAVAALDDLPGRGRKREITEEARAWLVSLACRKPTELGYAQELWTTALLAEHARRHCAEAGHPSLSLLAKGTVSKILSAQPLRPHKVKYFLERRDPEFDGKMAQVLHVYKEVELLREGGKSDGRLRAYVSYDEKPGIQALGATAPDRPPKPGVHAEVGRDHEYVRHGTATLLAGLDLLTGHVHGAVADRHRSREFVDFLRQRPRLSEAGADPRDPRQPLGARLEGDPRLPGDDPEPLRVRVHAEARLVAEPGGVVLRQAGADAAARHPRGLEGRTQGAHPAAPRLAQRRPRWSSSGATDWTTWRRRDAAKFYFGNETLVVRFQNAICGGAGLLA